MKPGLCPVCRAPLRPRPFTITTKCRNCGYELPTFACYPKKKP